MSRLVEAYESQLAEAIKKTTKVEEHQKRVADKLKKSGAVLAFHGMGSGKQHPVDTKILTPTGWVRIDELQIGSMVIGSDGSPVHVTGIYPQGVKPSYRVSFSDLSSVEAGPEHLWTMLYPVAGRDWTPLVLTTNQMIDKPIIPGVGKRKSLVDLSKATLKLPMISSPIEFNNVSLPLPAYLVGQLIANGSLSSCSAILTINLDDKIDVLDRLSADEVEISRVDECLGHCVRLCIPGIMPAIRSLGMDVKSKDKRIPRIYMQATPEERIDLLHGLMDGDGTCSATKNRLSYSTLSPGLAEDVMELVECLGGIASIRVQDRREKGIEYGVRIRVPASIKPFYAKRKLSLYNPGRLALPVRTLLSVEYVRDVESMCISVDAPDCLYVTEHAILTHNTLTSILATQGDNPDVIVPASLRSNYQKEIDKHTTGKHKANVISYEKAVKDAPRSKTLVMDEVQAIGRSETERSQNLVKKGAHYDKKLILSGTPIRNHPSELAPLVNLMKGKGAMPVDKKAFEERYVKEVMSKPSFLGKLVGRQPVRTGYAIRNQRELEDLLRGHVDYHMPSQDNFPTKTEEVIEVRMSKEQQQKYDYALKKLANPVLAYKIKKGLPPSKAEAKDLNSFMAATRQISNTPGGYGGSTASPKISRAVEEAVKRYEKDKNFRAMVYSNYLDSGIKTYQTELNKHGISSEVFDGSLSDKQRQAVVDRYNSGKINVLLVSGAGAQGLDLKGTKLVQILEPHWNSARTEQAKARAIRFKSHDHLPEKERHVEVQTFHSTLRPNRFAQASNILDKVTHPVDTLVNLAQGKKSPPAMSADQYLAKMNKDKDELNEKFLDVLKKVGSEHDWMKSTGRKRESLIEVYGRFHESAWQQYTDEHGRKKKSAEEEIKIGRARNAIGSGFAMGVGTGAGAFNLTRGWGDDQSVKGQLKTGGKGFIAGSIFGAALGAYTGYKSRDGIVGKKIKEIQQLDKSHGDMTKVYLELKGRLHREPSMTELNKAWEDWEQAKIDEKIAKQKARELARAMKKMQQLKGDLDD